jgi:ribosome biogenesis GTPase
MTLTELGYDDWFRARRDALGQPDCAPARITRVDRDRYLVRNETGEVNAEPTGKLLFSSESEEDLPCVGDWVLVQYYNDGNLAIIHERFPRKSFLRRKAPGSESAYQMIASNLDAAFIMQSCDFDFNLRRMERYLVMVREGGIEPILLLSKTDLVGPEIAEARIAEIRQARIDAPVIAFSNEAADGPERVRRALERGKTYCLLGSSGVGKTTLLNHLLGRAAFETYPVREKDGRGRHTTSRRELTLLDGGGMVIDTPGMRELGLMGVGSSIADSFSDIHELSRGCRFSDCTHATELGCAILAAVESGSLGAGRYKSYMKLMRESAFHEMSHAERRRKDKRFGKMVRAAMKEVRKRKPLS